MMPGAVAYFVPPRSEFAAFSAAEQLARLWHEAYERYAFNEFGYLPRLWEQLTDADRLLHIQVAEELMLREVVAVLPACDHRVSTLKRIEVRQCDICGGYPRLISHYTDRPEGQSA